MEDKDRVFNQLDWEGRKMFVDLIKQIEDKWYKECERFSNIIDDYKKKLNSKSPKSHPDYIKLKEELRLTNEVYNDVCIERDKLKSSHNKNVGGEDVK